jgi:2-polyprenyl-3-methyl-5-hydroxy-6-metoxy-1,4-benzoquinol methylase
MAYQDFLREFASAQQVVSVEVLLTQFKDKYSFQIKNRERAKRLVEHVGNNLPIEFAGARILDVGCGYGSFAIETANVGGKVVGIDTNTKWLKLADANALAEADCTFINCDASSRKSVRDLRKFAPFDIVTANDVFEHIYDTAGLLENLRDLTQPGSFVYYRVTNGFALKSVLAGGHKKFVGVNLLAPDHWPMFVKAPFHVYYRRESFYQSLFQHFGYKPVVDLTQNMDATIGLTRDLILRDLQELRSRIKTEKFETPSHLATIKRAVDLYAIEIEADIKDMDWFALYRKYRAANWSGVLQR